MKSAKCTSCGASIEVDETHEVDFGKNNS